MIQSFASFSPYKEEAILENQEILKNLKVIIDSLPANASLDHRHNICVDYLVSLILYLDIFQKDKFNGIAENGYLEEVIETNPACLG